MAVVAVGERRRLGDYARFEYRDRAARAAADVARFSQHATARDMSVNRRVTIMQVRRSLLLAAVLVLGIGPLLAQEDAKVQERRQEIDRSAQATLDELLKTHDGVRDLYGRAAGYAVFTVTKGGFIVSGGGGNGVAVDKASGQRTYMRMGTGGIGLGIGGQRYGLVVLFENADRLGKFVAGGWDSSATAEAVAGQEGVAVRSSFIDGVALYQITEKGLMAHADVSGTKFWVNDELR
jgi:lipid-binding SYLF domain-containing protein